ncbi:hypothetical protein P9112_000467 [Eukaryota sp. TZLM1-RC]
MTNSPAPLNTFINAEAERTISVLKEAAQKAEALSLVATNIQPQLSTLKSIDPVTTDQILHFFDLQHQYTELFSSIGHGSRVRLEASTEYSELVSDIRSTVRNFCSRIIRHQDYLDVLSMGKEDDHLAQFKHTLLELTRLTSAKVKSIKKSEDQDALKDEELSSLMIKQSKVTDEINRLKTDQSRQRSDNVIIQQSKAELIRKLKGQIEELDSSSQSSLSEIFSVNKIQRETAQKEFENQRQSLIEERDRLLKQWTSEVESHTTSEAEARTLKMQKLKIAQKWIDDYDNVMFEKQGSYDELKAKYDQVHEKLGELSAKWNEIDRLEALEEEKRKKEEEKQQHLKYIKSVIIIQSLWRRHQVLKVHGPMVKAAIDKLKPKKKGKKKGKKGKKGKKKGKK